MISSRSVTFTMFISVVLLFTFLINPACPAEESLQASESDPVLLVHGWGWPSGLTWPVMESRLEGDGYDVYTIDFSNVIGSNVQNAQELSERVTQILAETGEDKVDLVCHSMGGISSRYYIKHLGGDAKVKDVIELGSPNHGTALAYTCVLFSQGAREITPNCPFLQDLNSGDETPGPVKWSSIWSLHDEFNFPKWNCALDGARNRFVWWPVGHLSLAFDQQTYTWVVEGLEGGGWNNN